MPPSRRTVIPRAILHPQTASRAWGAFGFLQRLRPLPHQEAFRYDKRHCATWLPGFRADGVRSDFHSFLVLAKSSNLGDAHIDGLQGSLISPSHATETMPIEAMPSAFHEFSNESR